ncbi:MAG: hypothetical protein RMK19_02415 [Bacteroidia bacterium]|nr:hypothetical protein [Bacteroidia bacterium]MDW8014850.1 hypothetical protein [Bacteroidia bacterium]
MEIELLWPLIQELVQSPDLSEEDWSFLRQNADTLGCSEEVLRAMVEAHLACEDTDVLQRLQVLSHLIEVLGKEANRKLAFLLEVAQHLKLSVDLVQVLVQMPRTPALRFLARLLRVIEGTGDRMAFLPWLEKQAQSLNLSPLTVSHLAQLSEAAQKRSLTQALHSYWALLRSLSGQEMPLGEVAYLMELAREARLSEALTQGLQDFLRLRQKGLSPLESLAQLLRTFLQKGLLTDEELPFLTTLAQEEGVPQAVFEALIEVEKALRERVPGLFGGEVLQPLIRALILTDQLNESAHKLLDQRGSEMGLSHSQVEIIIDLEQQILTKKAKFPQSIQPLVRSLVENAAISDDRLVYLIKKAQELGGTDKLVRSLVQIEIAAQRKALQERITLVPPSEPAPPPPPPSLQVESPPPEKKTVVSSPPSVESSLSAAAKAATFPKGGNFPSIAYDFSCIKAFSLRNEKDIIRRAEVFFKDGRTNWYALVEYGERDYLLIARGRPDYRFEEPLSWAVSPTGEVIAVKHRLQGSFRVYLNGEEGRPLDDISNLLLSPNHRHLAYIARKGEEHFVFLDNIGMGPFMNVSNLAFKPNEENDLFFACQIDKNKWQIRDYLNNFYGEPAPVIDFLTFSPSGKRMVYVILKNRKFHLREGERLSEPYDAISDIQFTADDKHLTYLVRRGIQVGIVWDDTLLHMAEGISGVVLSPDSRFVVYIAREKEQNYLCIQKKSFGPYERVERPYITRTNPAVIYPVIVSGKHHIFINGSPEAGPFDAILKFSGQGDSYAALVRKGSEGQAMLWDGKLGRIYSAVDQFVWDTSGRNLAYVARRKGEWAGVVWNETESDHYDFVQHLTFDTEGKALLFFARRREGWYACLNDSPIPESLCKEILTRPIYDAKSRTFAYLYRQGRDIYEGRITLR